MPILKTMHRGAQPLPLDVLELFDVSWAPEAGGLTAYLQRMLDRCARWFGASGASVFLKGDEPDLYVLAVKAGSQANVPDGSQVWTGQGIAGACIQRRQPLLVLDPQQHPLLSGKRVAKKAGIGSSMVIPLIEASGGCLGVMNLSRGKSADAFCDTDLRLGSVLGRYIGLAVGNAHLFSDLHRAITEVGAARSKLQAVIGCLGVAIVVVDGSGGITEQNPEADKLLGKPQDRFSRAPSALSEELTGAMRRAAAGSTIRARARDSATGRSWLVVATPVGNSGVVAAIEEVTDEERAIAERARMSRLAEIGQMTATIAHEIRNPLTGIRSAAQMIMQSPEGSSAFAEMIEEEALKLNALCDEFLEFAKPLSLRIAQFDLADCVQQIAERFRHQFDAAKVRLHVSASKAVVSADERRMEQVLRNLLRNALEATRAGGLVTVTVSGSGFAVQDTGAGMTSEQIERLFTPFYTTKSRGTGLGLSTVRKIVEAHGGRIAVRSEPGRGTLVEVLLEGAASAEKRLSA